MARRMTIGDAAAASGLSAKMIRYYESIGLFQPETRSAPGYRLFSATDLHTLRFIRRARDLGFSMEEIAELLGLWRDRQRSSAEVKSLAVAHLANLERRINELQGMVDALRHLARHCHGDARPDCPILGDLAGEHAQRRPA